MANPTAATTKVTAAPKPVVPVAAAPAPVAAVEAPAVIPAPVGDLAAPAPDDAAETAAAPIEGDDVLRAGAGEHRDYGDEGDDEFQPSDEQLAAINDVAGQIELAELNAGLIRMAHPDGGACDNYATDEAGNLLVPLTDAALMIEHGFVVLEG